ncbi:BREX system ATP-binding domain-containing protein [Carboxydochorda subterranea]|uniref:BREX system ATP-binding domain-containing protein n=1 Tax=Carboxydichorda subterranea TaxID=3109565 RepID=A0ABZ1BTT1_9FIRM|nr:BREX system ATP-binding domain-containing protein [Limnochorda sp. L945t]WRP16194.1 BREX system ATP-binding domain-containing protein [Limnochorda sp. L945t]
MSTLEAQLRASVLAAEWQKPDPFWERFGLPQNPFPPARARTVISDLLHDQQHATARLAGLAGELLQPQPQRRALAVVGRTGVGKTHFLRHCLWAFERACAQAGRSFALVYVQTGVIKAFDLVVAVLDQADRVCAARGETDLVTAVVGQLARAPATVRDPLRQAGVEVDDLRHALERLVEAANPEGPRPARASYDELRALFARWIRGQTLTQSERHRLGVWQRIATASYGIRVLRDLLGLARSVGVLEGVLLCLDELETVFASGRRSTQYLPFLHDLGYFFDEAVRGSTGFALLVVSGCTDEGARKLQDVNSPLFERLGFKQEARVVLREILGVVDARDFAYAYVDYYHGLWKQRRPTQTPPEDPRTLLSEQEIEQCYWTAARMHPNRLHLSPAAAARDGGHPVTPASLLEQLHRLAEQKRSAQT